MKNKKAFFSIISAFFLVIVIVFILVAFVGLYLTLFAAKGGVSKNAQKLTNTKLFKDNLLLCHGTPYLLEEKLNSTECDNIAGVLGYEVLQEPFFGCEAKVFSKGTVNDTNSIKYSYRISVLQNNTHQTCLAKLIVHAG